MVNMALVYPSMDTQSINVCPELIYLTPIAVMLLLEHQPIASHHINALQMQIQSQILAYFYFCKILSQRTFLFL